MEASRKIARCFLVKIVSWNVNGLLRCLRTGFLKFLSDAKPDILCCQEIKGQRSINTPGYFQYWNPAKKKNYAGTLVLTKKEPVSVQNGFGIDKFDDEGRCITLEFNDFYLANIYAPSLHPHSPPDRLEFRIEWDKTLLSYVQALPKPVILCGDFNIAREYIDVYPENQKNTPSEPLFLSECVCRSQRSPRPAELSRDSAKVEQWDRPD